MDQINESSSAEPTDCEELQRYFASVFEDIDAYLAETDDAKRDERREQLDPLSITKRIEYTILVATGGPGYGFRLYYDPSCREWTHGVFFYAPWFGYEERPLSEAELEKVLDAYSMDCLTE